jgi:hypothetical protein
VNAKKGVPNICKWLLILQGVGALGRLEFLGQYLK